ncbi:MAG: gliding motility-associated C-terminal domain-containing protein [Lewinellaceae bacterium]|nr:gliding motility-associated C-terminal domain-containing protein [Phaeodactylibacter sp.]MCB9035058.1 gliding motility-associated C-terminal domain-containing protein [Lewinellaceae bacterium]
MSFRNTIPALGALFLLALPFTVRGTHIVGGEMNYTCLGNNQYEITLTIFRDCYNGNPNAWFDNPASIGVFNSQNILLEEILVPLMNNDTLDPVLSSECLVVPPNVCVHTTTYRTTINLPPIAGGYQLAYQRCCRNQTIVNIVDPLGTGATYGVTISEQALEECNSNPKFQQWPPIYICVNEPIVFDQSAIDQDGDSIVYRLCTPLSGANPVIPMPQPPNNPPYAPIAWINPPYNESNMLNGVAGGVALEIDSQTGLLTGLPNTIGQFVVGICVEEYRDGALISTTRRDFQYNVGQCGQAAAAFTAPEIQCDSRTVLFENESQGADDFIWLFNDPGNPGATATSANAVYTFSDTGLYTVMLIAEPGQVCEDTAFQQVYLQDNTLDAAFDYAFVSCSDSLVIQVTDLSQDPVSGLAEWYWELLPAGASSAEQNPTFVVTSNGNYTLRLTATAANGCQQILEEPFAAALIEEELAADTLAICSGESVFLNPDFNADYTYAWAPAEGIVDPANPNPEVQPLETTTYNVTISDGGGFCELELAATVVVPEPVTATAPADTVICSDSFLLEGQSNTGISFLWASDPDFDTVLSNSNTLEISPMGPETYYFLARDTFGCLTTDSIQVTGNGIDVLTTTERAVCPGDNGAVAAINLDPADTLSYSWSPSNLILAGSSSPTAIIGLSEPGAYALYVFLENQFGCTLQDSTSLTLIDTSSQLSFLVSQQCSGYAVQFSSSSVNAPFYNWNFGDTAAPNASAQGAAVVYAYPGPGTYPVTVTLSSFIECPDTLVQEIVVGEPAIAPAFTWEVIACSDSVTLQFFDQSVNDQSAIVAWEWDFGGGRFASVPNPVITLGASEVLNVQLAITSDDGCRDTVRQQFPVEVFQLALPDSITACPEQPAELNPMAVPGLNYQWSPAGLFEDPTQPNPIVILDASQLFSVTVTDESGLCRLEGEVAAVVPPPIEYELPQDTQSCEPDFLLFAESEQAVEFAWSTAPDFSAVFATTPEVMVQPGAASTYYLRLTDGQGCQVVDSVELARRQILVFLSESTAICRGDTVALELVNLTGDPLTYSWSPSSAIITGADTSSPLVSPQSNQVFTVQVMDEFGCMLTESTRVIVSEQVPPLSATAEPDTLFGPGQTQLEATLDGGYAYRWRPSQGLNNITIYNPTAQIDSTTTFTVEITDEEGCRNAVELRVVVVTECREPFIFVPNAFTPNGDNLNDLLFVEGKTIDELYFAVYNRWGEKVFETDDQSVGWDGTYKGRELSPDVFGYYLEARCFNEEAYFKKGNVTLIR